MPIHHHFRSSFHIVQRLLHVGIQMHCVNITEENPLLRSSLYFLKWFLRVISTSANQGWSFAHHSVVRRDWYVSSRYIFLEPFDTTKRLQGIQPGRLWTKSLSINLKGHGNEWFPKDPSFFPFLFVHHPRYVPDISYFADADCSP